jgi:AraC-like DNA-binding protein
MSQTILATAGRVLHRLLMRYGQEADDLFAECRLDPRKLDDPRARYPLDRMRALWRLADGRIRDSCWALAAGEVWKPTDFHALGYAFLASQTLEAAFYRLERYTRIVVTDAVTRVVNEGNEVSVSYLVPEPDLHFVPFVDSRIAILLRLCRDACGPRLPITQVHLSHGWRPCGYEDFCGCPVRYDAPESKIMFSLEGARTPLPAVNRDLARVNDRTLAEFARSLSESTFAGRVRKAIMEQLSSGKPRASQIARVLAMAPRTLQRRLQEEGTSFQAVLDDVRKELAIQFVQSGDLDLSEVAYLTGFSGASSFARAYKGWTGRSPSEDRVRV